MYNGIHNHLETENTETDILSIYKLWQSENIETIVFSDYRN